MNISPKERYLDICHFKRPGDLCMPSTLFGIGWEATQKQWIEEGAPKELLNNSRFETEYFQFDPICQLSFGKVYPKVDLGHGITMGGDFSGRGIVPPYEPRFISEDERTITFAGGAGRTVKTLKADIDAGWGGSMSMYLDHPVKDRATWNEHKKRLDPHTPERWPSDWDAYVQEMNSKSEPLSLPVGGFYGFPREWVGHDRMLYMFYDDPNLIEDMMEQLLYLETEIIKRVLKDIKVQQVTYFEDMCYKAGPLISPAMVRKFMMPRYKKITDLVHSYGVDIIYLDSDGNTNELLPLWLECGINFIWPFEVAAGNDVLAVRKKYGKDLIIGGGIDKRALIKGKEATREEVMSKVPFLLEQGGYFACVDHRVPPDVTFENYCYYLNLVREIGGLEKISF